MHDLSWIRDNPEIFRKNTAKRKENVDVDNILDIDQKHRKLISDLQSLQKERNEKSKAIGKILDKKSDEFIYAKNQVNKINKKIHLLKEQEQNTQQKLLDILSSIPNCVADDVPIGANEEQNFLVTQWGQKTILSFKAKHHFELGEELKMMNFVETAQISGSRFVSLKKDLAKLERALAHFMLDTHINEYGFEEISPPVMVKSQAMYGTGNLPKFGEDAFETKDGYWLVPTSEVFLTNLVANQIIDENRLPFRYTAYTPCFRSEAGSAGKDTRGMIRLHQFSKVELVTITNKENYLSEYDNLLNAAESILKKLKIPYQKILKCSGDTTFSACKTYDLEAWLPGQNCYREISSCSIFGQFQGRRMKARYRKKGSKETHFVYTMNGSALAVGRTIVAIMENYQNKDGSINIPEVLKPYMNGQEIIKAN